MECSLELLDRGLLVSLQDLGAAGLTSSRVRDGVQGRGRARPRRRARAAARGRHGAVRDHGLRVAGADALRLRAGAARRGARRLRDAGRSTGPRSARSPTPGAMRVFDGDELVGDMPVAALVDDCPLYDLAPERPDAPLYPRRRATLAPGVEPAEALLALLRSPNIASRRPLFEQYDWIVQSRTVRRPEEADAAVLLLPDGVGARRLDRRQRPPRRRRPVPRARSRRARVRGQPRLRRRRAARPDEQPELRQPREAAHRLAADRGGPRPRRRLPRARTCRSSAATSRSTTRAPAGPIYPTPVVGMVGRLPDARARRPARVRAARATRSRSPARSHPSLGAGELAKLCGEPLPDGLPGVDVAAVARGASRPSATRCAPAR